VSRRRADVRTFGPTPLFWVAGVVMLALGLVTLDGLLGWGVTGWSGGASLLIFVVPTLILLLAGWKRYQLDAEGMHVRDLWGARFAAWADLAGVTARQVTEHHRPTHIETVVPQTFFYVRDLRGRIFSTVGPWIAKRRELVYESRRRIKAAEDD